MRLLLLFISIFFMSPELIFANIDIVLFKKASINKIYSSKNVYLNSGDKFRFLIRSDKSDNFEITLTKNSEETDKNRIKINANEEVYVPGESQWYTFYENFESIKLSINNNVLSKEMVLHKLINHTYDSSLLKGDTLNGKYRNDSYFHNEENLPKIIPSVAIKKRDTTRGVEGQLVYNDISKLVVLISSGSAIGSGVIISLDGLILTNWHVIQDYKSVGVTFKPPGFNEVDPSNQYIADVLGTNEVSDLALIQLRNTSNIHAFAEFANESDIKVASTVHAIGHPEREYWSYTEGVVSMYRKNYTWESNNYKFKADVIQTQTPMNPGNSGGPLLNDDKKILGINSFVRRPGLNYAVSISTVKEFLKNKRSIVNPTIKKRKMLLSEKLDTNNDGIADAERYDTNDNGKYDVLAIDSNKDGIIDRWHHDQNENNKWELIIEYDSNKEINTWYYDSNEDKITDRIGIDSDLDGYVNYFIEI